MPICIEGCLLITFENYRNFTKRKEDGKHAMKVYGPLKKL
jgi:hypothetical protein